MCWLMNDISANMLRLFCSPQSLLQPKPVQTWLLNTTNRNGTLLMPKSWSLTYRFHIHMQISIYRNPFLFPTGSRSEEQILSCPKSHRNIQTFWKFGWLMSMYFFPRDSSVLAERLQSEAVLSRTMSSYIYMLYSSIMLPCQKKKTFRTAV